MWDSFDVVNALFGIGVAFAIGASVKEGIMNGRIEGVSFWTPLFFCCLGVWNVVYYLHLSQWVSTLIACVVLAIESLWLLLVLTLGAHNNEHG